MQEKGSNGGEDHCPAVRAVLGRADLGTYLDATQGATALVSSVAAMDATNCSIIIGS